MKRQPVKSASRVLKVLELFRDRRRPMRLHEVYDALDYPQSSATNLLKSMVIEGYLTYSRTTREYMPTLQVASLGSWLYGHVLAGKGYGWLMDELFRSSDETVALVAQNDLFIQYMMIRAPDHPHKRPPDPGQMRLMIHSSSGLALLSQMRDREIDKVFRYSNYYELNAASSDRTDGEDGTSGIRGMSVPRLIEHEELMSRIRWIRHTGYCFWTDLPVPGIASIAIPLGESMHGVPLVVGIGGTTERLTARRAFLVDLLRGKVAEFHERTAAGEWAEASVGDGSDRLPSVG